MKVLGNIIWIIFGGLMISLEYIVAGFLMILTIVGAPFGLQAIKIGVMALTPFGSHVKRSESSMGGCLNVTLNIIWLFVGGFWIALTHVLWGVLFYITIIGIPFGKQHFKLVSLALSPFGKTIA